MAWFRAPLAIGREPRRLTRIIKGFANSSSRPRYVAAVRERLRRIRQIERGGPESCLVCRSPNLRQATVAFSKNPSRVCRIRICRRCGYISNPYNTNDYGDRKHIENLPTGTRAGTSERPGREYHMAKMASEILGRDDLEVLIYGAGRSLDNHHIKQLPQVHNVAIGDIMKLRNDAEFIDANKPAPRRFPVIIASEVIEHFREPRKDFAKLFEFVERDGLIVCGTNIYNGGDLSKDAYLFYSDHTSYYSPQALIRIARDAGYRIDFRAPLVGTAMRKRYVLFTKSPRVLEQVAGYFGARMYAPSEKSRSTERRLTRQAMGNV